jgi:CHASE3 domain sensor protein
VRTDWVRHTYEVLANIQKVKSDIIGVQAAVRGFVITGREESLAPYREAVRQEQEDESTLRNLTADNPRQHLRLSTLGDLVRQRLSLSQETVNLRWDVGFAAAAVLISTGRGQQSRGPGRRRQPDSHRCRSERPPVHHALRCLPASFVPVGGTLHP